MAKASWTTKLDWPIQLAAGLVATAAALPAVARVMAGPATTRQWWQAIGWSVIALLCFTSAIVVRRKHLLAARRRKSDASHLDRAGRSADGADDLPKML
jgi:hypothetical protein